MSLGDFTKSFVPGAVAFAGGGPWLSGLAAGGTTLLTGGRLKDALLSGGLAGFGHYLGGKVGGYFGSSNIWWKVGGTLAGSYFANRSISKMKKLRQQKREEKKLELESGKARDLGIPHAPEDPMGEFVKKYLEHREASSRAGIGLGTEPKHRPIQQIMATKAGLQNLNVEAVDPNARPKYHDPGGGAIDPPPQRKNTDRSTFTQEDEKMRHPVHPGANDRIWTSMLGKEQPRLVKYIPKPRARINQFTGKMVYA